MLIWLYYSLTMVGFTKKNLRPPELLYQKFTLHYNLVSQNHPLDIHKQ